MTQVAGKLQRTHTCSLDVFHFWKPIKTPQAAASNCESYTWLWKLRPCQDIAHRAWLWQNIMFLMIRIYTIMMTDSIRPWLSVYCYTVLGVMGEHQFLWLQMVYFHQRTSLWKKTLEDARICSCHIFSSLAALKGLGFAGCRASEQSPVTVLYTGCAAQLQISCLVLRRRSVGR